MIGRRLVPRLGWLRRMVRWPFLHPFKAIWLAFLVQLALEKGL